MTRISLCMLLILCVMVFSGCEKNDFDKIRLQNVTNLRQGSVVTRTEFDYNSHGQLTHMTKVDSDGDVTYDADIDYNKKNQPVRYRYKFSPSQEEDTTIIEWTETGFITYLGSSHKYVYLLNSDNQISKRYLLYRIEGTSEYDTSAFMDYQWYGKEKLIVTDSNIYSGMIHTDIFVFAPHPHPYRAINISLLTLIPFYTLGLQGEQNLYCPTHLSHSYNSEESYTTMTYRYNESGYPVYAYIRYMEEPDTERSFQYGIY